MRFTAEEIKNQKFKKKFRGLDPEEVEVFASMVADDFEEFEKENKSLKRRIKDCKLEVEALQKSEAEFKEIIANREGDASPLDAPEDKARELILKARQKAREIKEIAMREAMEIEREISRLRALKKGMESPAGDAELS